MGAECPVCGYSKSFTTDSRVINGVRRRRYECDKGHTFATVEMLVKRGHISTAEVSHSGQIATSCRTEEEVKKARVRKLIDLLGA